MKVEKRGNKYRIQPTINGRRHSITLDHNPTQREIAEIIESLDLTINGESTFEKAYQCMISDKSNILSPSTIRGYDSIMRGMSAHFKNLILNSITSNDIQREINRTAARTSTKTVYNYYALITSVLAYFKPLSNYVVKLPPKNTKPIYVPNTSDIQALLQDARTNGFGQKYILPIMLGCLGMRLGEITALTDADIKDNYITINKTKVLNSNNEYVIKKTAKTSKSNRIIKVSDEVIAVYKEFGLYQGYPKSINDYLTKRQKALGIEHFSFHKLRHYFASKSIDNGVPLPTVQDFGGWSTSKTVNRVYAHNMRDYSEVVDAIGSTFK